LNRSVLLIALALIVSVTILLSYQRLTPRSEERDSYLGSSADRNKGYRALPETSSVALSEADRGRIREFWKVYERATQKKQAGQWAQAERDYRNALELNPGHWDSLYYLGNARMELGRYAEAEQAYLKLAEADSQAARAYSALGALYSDPKAGSMFDLKKAEREYTRAWRANADESGSVLRLGEVALAAGQNAKAKEYLEAAGRTNFKSVNASFLLGYLAWESNDSVHAMEQFRQAIALTKENKPPGGVLGEGDTRLPDNRALTLPGQRGLFDALIATLWIDKDTSQDHASRLYRQVRDLIEQLPDKKKR
jgi:tetratricopeptide (TPR) repeat protein